MDVDLIIKNANLSNDQTGVDIACKDGVIISIERGINANAKKTIDAQGHLVSPPFVDPHFHMDATLSLGTPRMNVSGTLLEGISLWSELKPIQNVEQIIDRALRYCDLAVSMGIGAIRSHVDICDNSLKGVEALLEVQRKVAPYIELQLVAFPQDGIFRDPSAKVNLINALDMGVNVVGGIPHFERTMQDGADSVKFLCEIAADRGLMVDMHCDESDDPQSRHIETLAFETSRLGLHGRVAGSHLTSMHSMDNYYVSKLIPLMAEAEIHAIPNPLINIMLQGRHDSYPKRRGQTRVPELKNAGINVGFGSDCVMDPWYSLGKADMLDVAHMGLHVGQLSSRLDMEWCFDAVTLNSANIMGLEGYGLKRGCKADMVILQANDKIDAIRLRANRLFVIRAGK
ncbi:amidohydrolase family protein, partial [Amylibacter sp.]|nr:amidohydrolase family protein [Amylibacter sp.]